VSGAKQVRVEVVGQFPRPP